MIFPFRTYVNDRLHTLSTGQATAQHGPSEVSIEQKFNHGQ
jgi:hypothetical protein